ncbi:MAG: hypothetical protein PHI85_09025 [Victivallaceae bacterium]|nr:hypothetical protein [Victivallaceae bacterium]
MRKIFLAVAALFAAVSVFAVDGVSDLVKFVPQGTNVILYVNASRLMQTKLLDAMCRENVKLGNMVDGIRYHEERLDIKGQAIKNLLLCRDTSKATASFYLLNTIVPEDKFEDVFVADYAFFIESRKSSVEFGPRKREIPIFELVRKRTPEQKYGAVYIGNKMDDGNYVVAVVPRDYIIDTLEALQSPPVSGEVASVAGGSMNPGAIAWMVASLKNKGEAISTWDKILDGLVFAEVTFDLTGPDENIVIQARFYSDSTLGNGIRTASSAQRFIADLRREKNVWLDSIFDRSNEELRERVDKCIQIYPKDGNVILDVEIPAALYREICDISPHVVADLLGVVCEKFQLVEPEMLGAPESPQPQTASAVNSAELFD